MTVPMSQSTFTLIRKLICSLSGLEFPESKKYLLESRLTPRLGAIHCQTFEEYYQYLRSSPLREKEVIELMNCVTTNETFFFRDQAQIDCFRHVIIPQVMKEQERHGKLRLWSAGCSSGEEAYTLAMVLAEEFPSLAGWDIEIFATDISEHILGRAREGVYGPYSVRNVPSHYLQKYFVAKNGQYSVGSTLRKFVTFSRVNLIDTFRMSAFRDVDVIFCRNVLIYFDQEARQKIMKSLYQALHPSGVLVVGFSESLNGVNPLFQPITCKKTVMYGKASSLHPRSHTAVASGYSSP